MELAAILIFEIVIAAILLIVAAMALIRILRFALQVTIAVFGMIAGLPASMVRWLGERRSSRAERLWMERLSDDAARIEPRFDPDARRRSRE